MKTKQIKPSWGGLLMLLILLTSFLNHKSYAICNDPSISGPRVLCSSGSTTASGTYFSDFQYTEKVTWEITGGTFYNLPSQNSLPQNVHIDEQSTTKIVYSIETGNTSGAPSPVKTIDVSWFTGSGTLKLTIEKSGLIGICGTRSTSVDIKTSGSIPNFTLTSSSGSTLNCNQGTTIQGAPWIPLNDFERNFLGYGYSWASNGAHIASNWETGVYIDKFTNDGPVTILASVTNACGTRSKFITLTVNQPTIGNVTQNGTPVGNVIPNCQGNFWLSLPGWISPDAIYTWELPGYYDSQTGEYTKVIQSGNNLRDVSGNLQQGALVDFTGKVTVSGICGPPQVRTFVVKALQSPTIDNQIVSCSNVVAISAQNPNGTSCNWWSQNGGTFTSTSCQSAIFTAPGKGEYIINLGTNGPGGCYNQLTTTVKIQGTSNGATAGWASGVLSDIREKPGSNVAVVGGKVYFAGRDGKLNYYFFDNATDKWIMATLPGVTNAKIPGTGAFNKIATTTESGTNYLYYIDNANHLQKMNLSTNVVTNPITYGSPQVRDFAVNNAGDGFIYVINNSTITTLISQTPLDNLSSASLKVAISGAELIYIKNNTLYSTLQGQLYSSGSYPGTDVVYFNNNLYFTSGILGSADLFHLDLISLTSERITYSGNLTGVFSINPTTGTLYYGVKSSSTLPTVGSGTFNRAEIYQARYISNAWSIIKTTSGNNFEGSDNFIFGPVFDGNHLFYVGAGGSVATGTQKEIEVWNLFYESACTPSVFRTGSFDENSATTISESNAVAYPNPFDQELTLSANATEGEVLAELYNATGQLVFSKNLDGITNINTTEFTSGLYTLLIKQNGKIIKREKLAHK